MVSSEIPAPVPQLTGVTVEVLIRVLDEGSRRRDCRVTLDPGVTVHSLVTALLERQVVPGPAAGLRLRHVASGHDLDPLLSIAESGIVSGTELMVHHQPGGQVGPAGGDQVGQVVLDVKSGPSTGRLFLLSPGAHSIGKGANQSCVIFGPQVQAAHLELGVTASGDVYISRIQGPTQVLVGSTTTPAVPNQPLPLPCQLLLGDSVALELSAIAPAIPAGRDLAGQVLFNRMPYHQTLVEPLAIEPLVSPPQTPNRQRLSYAAALVPLVAGVVFAMLTGQLLFLMFAAMSPVMVAWSYFEQRRGGKVTFGRQEQHWRKTLVLRKAALAQALDDERAARFEASPDVSQLVRRALLRHPQLWERSLDTSDFMALRVGRGQLPSLVTTSVSAGGDEELRDEAAAELATPRILDDVPVVVEVAADRVLGVYGDTDIVDELVVSMVTQTAILHSPEEVVICASLNPDTATRWDWLKWLPHCRSANSPLEGDQITVDTRSGNRLLGALQELAERQIAGDGPPSRVHILCVLFEHLGIDRSLLTATLDTINAAATNAGSATMSVIWAGKSDTTLPRACMTTIDTGSIARPSLLRYVDTRADIAFVPEPLGAETAEKAAMSLAPLRDVGAATTNTAIPRQVALLDLLAGSDSPQDLAAGWQLPPSGHLAAPIGQGAQGPVVLDLVDQGPHALIAGTSGAGKSELLQTWVGALSARYSPQRLNFLFVDYKGGAAIHDFRQLPHAVGFVTDLDERLSRRALISLGAELRRRESLLEGRAKDLDELLRVSPDIAPASLVIIIDEFATLAREIPDFVTGVVDVAQRGRSLGIHLVLATQRPAGVVNENILANTNLRVSLRVLDRADSQSVLGVQDAADIPAPLRGRAIARVGPRELVLFQAGWATAPYDPTVTSTRPTIVPFRVGLTQVVEYNAPKPTSAEQLEVLVSRVSQASDLLHLEPPRRPWLEPLADIIPLVTAKQAATVSSDAGREVVYGMVDDPDRQTQRAAVSDLEESGGLLIFGSGGSGKTTALHTIAASLAMVGTPSQVRIYGLDFASRALEHISALPHCAGVAHADDPDLVARVITLLEREVDERRRAMANAKLASLSEWRSERRSPMARIVVLIDNYAGFQAAFERYDYGEWLARMSRLIIDGRQVGIHFVITADRRVSVPGAVFSAMADRVVLRMADPEELIGFGVPPVMARDIDLPPGRGYLNGTLETQIACLSKETSQVAALDQIGRQLDQQLTANNKPRAPKLERLQADIKLNQLPVARTRLCAVIGLRDEDLSPAEVDLNAGHLCVVGPPGSGRSTALVSIVAGLTARKTRDQCWAVGEEVLGCSKTLLGLGDLVTTLNSTKIRPGEPVVVVVDDADDLPPDSLGPLLADGRVRFVLGLQTMTLQRAFSGPLSDLKRAHHVVLLQPELDTDGDLVGSRLVTRPGQLWPPGRGFLAQDRVVSQIQVARKR